MKYAITPNGIIETVTPAELADQLARREDIRSRARYEGKKYARLNPPITGTAVGGVLQIGGDKPSPAGTDMPLSPRAGYCWMFRRISVTGLTDATPAGQSATTTGVTGAAPAAGTVITSQALAAGTYNVQWQAQLSGAAAAGDANNFGLYNGATLVATSENLGAIGTYPQPSEVIIIPAGGATLAVKNIGAGTAGSIYGAELTTALQASPGDIVNLMRRGEPVWQFTGAGPLAFATFSFAELCYLEGETLSLVSVGAFAATGQITLRGDFIELPQVKMFEAEY